MFIIEKVIILRGVPIFANIPDFSLASIAQITDEVDLVDGATFIQEGALEDSMYIIVEGQVQVHRKGKPIITLRSGQTVGELAVLDPEPRSASATAVGDTYLFRIGKEAFDEIMADRPEIAQGVIRALCQRVREQGRLVTGQAGD